MVSKITSLGWSQPLTTVILDLAFPSNDVQAFNSLAGVSIGKVASDSKVAVRGVDSSRMQSSWCV